MLISTSKRFIFIANMKTASTAIETALRWASEIAVVEDRFGKHQSFREIVDRFDWLFSAIGLEEFFKFGVIRDPCDYMVSLYNSHMHPRFKDDPQLFSGALDFDDFLNEWVPRNLAQVTQQHLRFRDENGRIAANYIVSYDKLADGLRFVGELVGVVGLTTMGNENVSYGSFQSSSLSGQQRAWIETRFEGDREMLDNYCNRPLGPWLRSDPVDLNPVAEEDILCPARFQDAPECGSQSFPIAEEDLVRAFYRTMLLREPDSPGLIHYAERLRSGLSVEQLIHIFLGSEEFAQKQATCRHTCQLHDAAAAAGSSLDDG